MKKPIALLLNDLHISKDTVTDFVTNWDEALAVCKQNGITKMFIGGDVFTDRSSQPLSVLLAVKDAYSNALSLGIDVTVYDGNHDKRDQEETAGYNSVFEGVRKQRGRFRYVPEYFVEKFEGLLDEDSEPWALMMIGYFPENGSFLPRLARILAEEKSEWGDERIKSESQIILYIHEGIHGVLGDYDIPNELPQEPFMDFKAVLVGHYHNRAKVKNTPIEYIGSSRQHNFGEDEEKGYTILYSDGSRQFVKNQVNTRYSTVLIDFNDIDTYDKWVPESAEDALYKFKAKVVCDDKQASVLDRQKLIDLGFSKVEVVSREDAPKPCAKAAITEKYDKQGLIAEYLGFCQEQGIESYLGVKYLSEN